MFIILPGLNSVPMVNILRLLPLFLAWMDCQTTLDTSRNQLTIYVRNHSNAPSLTRTEAVLLACTVLGSSRSGSTA